MHPANIDAQVAQSLAEDIGDGDISAALIESQARAAAQIKCREPAVVCGIPWANSVFRQLDPTIELNWLVAEGQAVAANQIWVQINGPARALLTGERCAINWLQTLSGTATQVRQFLTALAGTKTQLLDTRKTIPGLRAAQKYAVRTGGGRNHRLGLFDAYLIKENHIAGAGSITQAIARARQLQPGKIVEIEVETLVQLQEALAAKADIIMLDNFDLPAIAQAVSINAGQAKLEISGNVNLDNIRRYALTGVDYISVGALTKHLRAIDLSMRFIEAND
jgi:nicotinate-nucleotide pyrophosphorylase (carboxylating)